MYLALQLSQALPAGLQLNLEARSIHEGGALVGARELGLHARALALGLHARQLGLGQQLRLPLGLRLEELRLLRELYSLSQDVVTCNVQCSEWLGPLKCVSSERSRSASSSALLSSSACLSG